MHIEYRKNTLTPEQYQYLRQCAGMLAVDGPTLRRALANTWLTVTAYVDGALAGMARAVGDQGLFYYIQDVLVAEQDRGAGIGSGLVGVLLAEIRSNTPAHITAQVGLISSPHRERFYEKLGFARCPSMTAGHGMVACVPGNFRKAYTLKEIRKAEKKGVDPA